MDKRKERWGDSGRFRCRQGKDNVNRKNKGRPRKNVRRKKSKERRE